MATRALPKHWDSNTRYFYRKLAGLSNQTLIDKLVDCAHILRGRKPLVPPYTRMQIISIMKAARYLLQEERKIDIGLAQKMYEELMKEVEKEIARQL